MDTQRPAPGSGAGLSVVEDLFGFFRELVERAVARLGAPVSQEAAWYLARLLEEFGRTEQLVDADRQVPTLTELLLEARAAGGASLRRYRRLADFSLYASGYLRRFLAERRVDPGWYQEVGASAYQLLARAAGGTEGLGQVFQELASHYGSCVDVLSDVRDLGSEDDPGALLRLYEEWLATRNPRLRARLWSLGLMADGSSDPA